MMKSVLIPTDFSTHSRHATQVVLELLKETPDPCKILLLNTYVVQNNDPEQIISLNDELKKQSKLGLERVREEAQSWVSNSNIKIEVVSHMGSLANVILHLLNKEKVDLVALGMDGGRHVETLKKLLWQKKCQLLVTSSGEGR